ncbi:hypothetical protein B2J86_14020, partial [Acidovorax sp. SRB_14]|uniref:hypothetical protein n=1 Tax=Acidovorax sp. SRB_14 TaxID=1962699 RepID=UPI001C208D07
MHSLPFFPGSAPVALPPHATAPRDSALRRRALLGGLAGSALLAPWSMQAARPAARTRAAADDG